MEIDLQYKYRKAHDIGKIALYFNPEVDVIYEMQIKTVQSLGEL